MVLMHEETRMTSFLHPAAIHNRMYMAQHLSIKTFGGSFKCYRQNSSFKYGPFCDDFGPMNLACIVRFIESIDKELVSYPLNKIVWCIDEGRRNLTNAVFLLGAYMILKQGKLSGEVAARFSWIDEMMLEPFRDASHFAADFELQLIDCWRGLEKGVQRGWVRFASSGYMWGEIDIDEYEHNSNPANGDLQEVVPGKVVVLKDPVDLGDDNYRDSAAGVRDFSPSYYAESLADMGVSTEVQLSPPSYSAEAFTSRGFAHHRLDFSHSECPPDAVVAAFLNILDAATGVVAVHCQTGLGRTGTLVALYLMRSHGFSGREAMGWLRIMRPGSVIGPQQHYLCAVDAAREARLRLSLIAGRETAASDAAVQTGIKVQRNVQN